MQKDGILGAIIIGILTMSTTPWWWHRLFDGATQHEVKGQVLPSPPVLARTVPNAPSVDSTLCCATNCVTGARCVHCDVRTAPWQVRVSGVGFQEPGQGMVDLARSAEWSNVEACVYFGSSPRGGCVPLEQAVRPGGVAVPGLPTFTVEDLLSVGVHVQVVATKDGERRLIADKVRLLQVSPKAVCEGYHVVDSASRYFVSLFLVDARPE